MSQQQLTKDTGYAWIIVLASFVSQFIQYGNIWTGGIFYVVFLEHIEGTKGAVALISSMTIAIFHLTGKFLC